MNISPLTINVTGEEIVLNYQVSFANKECTLWYSIAKDYQSFVTEALDGPVVALLIPAMKIGEDIHIAGSISERLFYNLSRPYQVLLKHLIPSLNLIKIYCNNLIVRNVRAPGVATGFSCGIDSFCLLADHYYSNVTKGFKITHLLFNNVGSHGTGNEHLFNERYSKNAPLAEKIGLPLIKVNSNLDHFYQNYQYSHTETPRNVSVPLILQNGLGRFLYASTYSYPDTYIRPSTLMSHSDPAALPLLSTESLDIHASGSEYTRVMKTLRVASIEDSFYFLDVCTNPTKAGNCSKCKKCLRTLLTLEIAGLIDKYSKAFDLLIYKRGRKKFMGEVLSSNDPFLREIAQYAKDQRYSFPFESYLYSIQFFVNRHFLNFQQGMHELISRLKKTNYVNNNQLSK